MKAIILLLCLLAIFAGVLFCWRQLRLERPPPVITSQGPTVERLERLSHLVTSRVYVVDVLIGEGEGCRGVWLIYGDAWLAVDLSKAVIVEKDEAAKQALIRLPQPAVLTARVNHEKTKVWELRTTTWIPWHADQDRLRDEVMLQAQRLVGAAAAAKENIEHARRAAEVIIRVLYEEVGWDVKIIWAEKRAANVNAVPAGLCQR